MRHKIINDPVHGFINIEDELILQLLDHPWMQRLRRIRQLGMSNLVYPGAQHTRFQHALGAMHLMQMALDNLSYNKGVFITPSEYQGSLAAILLHDVGHGPFSHALEHLIVNADHEEISNLIMARINFQLDGALSEAISIFGGECRPFLHQLISSQLDTDRLDYLKRDSFFSGVVEGNIGSDRIIKMLDVTEDWNLCVEAKGIYTIEDFLLARRLMYWQVYLHKTVVTAEQMLRQAVRRARALAASGSLPTTSPSLSFFLKNNIDADALIANDQTLSAFCSLDDDDVTVSLKLWAQSPDTILAFLSSSIINRRLFHIELSKQPFSSERIEQEHLKATKALNVDVSQAQYLVSTGSLSTHFSSFPSNQINILYRDGSIKDLSQASDIIRPQIFNSSDMRYFLCSPRS